MAKSRRSNSSLRSRLLISAALVMVVFLGLMGVVLDRAFQKSAEQSVSERLLVQVYGLLSVADVNEAELLMPDILTEPRFNNLGSGLAAVVLNEANELLWRSPSSYDLEFNFSGYQSTFTNLTPGVGEFNRFSAEHDEFKTSYFDLSYRFLWQLQNGTTTPFVVVVLESRSAYDKQVASYRNNLWGGLAFVIVALVIVQAAVMGWGLAPLQILAADLKAIEDGREEYLDGNYPAELAGVTNNLNLLLASERQQREKYRTTLGDLAHSLKTPLAILQGGAAQLNQSDATSYSELKETVQETIDEQVQRMDQIIAYQLERAVADSATLIKNAIEVVPIVEKLVAAMEKVYCDKQIRIQQNLVPCTFFGDERDLMEMLGNLLDNACKYGTQNVKLSVTENDLEQLLISIEDDGPGIPAIDRHKILSRGMRLDSQEVGQGIGLAVVVEIVDRYCGEIKIDDSDLGGALIKLTLA